MAQTDQEHFWQGEFGDQYNQRNSGAPLVAWNTAFFTPIVRRMHNVRSINELGANIGLNLLALKNLLPAAELTGVEINAKAVAELAANLPEATVYHQSILDFVPQRTWDFVFTKAVLIHINPQALPEVYTKLYAAAGRYLMVAEYYNPAAVEVTYRGHSGKLFKRDFAGEMLRQYPDLTLVDYGFVYHGDVNFPQDDITWFLLEKK